MDKEQIIGSNRWNFSKEYAIIVWIILQREFFDKNNYVPLPLDDKGGVCSGIDGRRVWEHRRIVARSGGPCQPVRHRIKERIGNKMSLTSQNKLENNTVELLIHVSEEQFQDALMKAYKKKVKSIALPGFRKGKAPKAMIEKMYGKEFFYDDAINMVYPTAYEEAVEEAKRCIQCHCDECIKSCVYLSEYKKHPGLLAREIYNNTQIIMGDHPMNKPMNACALCGQCTVICPNGFDMSQVCKSARENMVSTDKMPLAPHEFALMDMLFSNSEAFLSRLQPGYETCRYVFFPGCQAGAIAPDVVMQAYEDLSNRVDGGVALMLGCCGAISEWAGRYEMTEKVNEQLKQELAKLGDPAIIAGCPSCMKQLKESTGAVVTGVWEILKEIGLPETARGLEVPVAIHDACGARGDVHTQDTIRELLTEMGCTVENTEYSRDLSPCCGYGGLTAYANKEMADKMTEKCLERSDSPYITYCMACRDRFVREGRESRHILELLYGINAANMPDISEKRYNRLILKQTLLKNIWNEEPIMEKKDYTVAYTEEAIHMMDERMILKSDVERVLSDYRENQEAILDEETKELVTRSRLGNVTFWVRFVETEDGYLVHRAYSHRMNIMKRVGQ